MLVPMSASIGNAYRSANGIVQFSLLLGACQRQSEARMRKRDRRRESTSLPLTMQHNWARGSARRRAARRRASGSECPQSPRLRDLAVVELGRPLGAGASWARHVTAPKWRVLRAGDCESADAYPYLRWAL